MKNKEAYEQVRDLVDLVKSGVLIYKLREYIIWCVNSYHIFYGEMEKMKQLTLLECFKIK